MSSSPPKLPSAPKPVTLAGAAPPRPRPKPAVSIFTTKKKPVRKPNPNTTAPGQVPNGTVQPQPAQRMANGVNSAAAPKPEEANYQEFPIVVTKDALLRGLHYHALKLQSRADKDGNMTLVNPYDADQFTRPVRLHRRSARDKIETAEHSDGASGMDDKEREQMTMRRAERQAEREANQALIAPTGGDSKKPIKQKPQKKVELVYYDENDPKQKQRAQLRYEEARPWHLEDFDGKNVWVGSYEEPLSGTSVLFEIGAEGFKMVPVEKWYKFTQTNRVKVMDSDAVEKHMEKEKRGKAPRWFLGTQESNDAIRRQVAMEARAQRVTQMRGGDDEDRNAFGNREEYHADVDEIDYEYNDEFQDDDEGHIFGEQEDDDTREIEQKIRAEMRQANLAGTDVKEDKDWDEEEQKEKEKEQEEKRRTKRLRKQLIKKERKNEYDSDSDRGEFSESSEDEDSEEERARLEEERKQEEARKLNGDKSGASTKGTNTPTGRAEKRDSAKSLVASLKRPGSPDLSEMSGNESSRKKAKGINGRAMASNPGGGARSLSPDTAKSKRPKPSGSGSGSDTDTSRSGRLKIRVKASPPGSPQELSPKPSRSGSPSGTGSRAQSPKPKPTAPFPTVDEVRAAIPPEGISGADLVALFRSRVPTVRGTEFIGLVRQAGTQDKVTKKIFRNKGAGVEGAVVEKK